MPRSFSFKWKLGCIWGICLFESNIWIFEATFEQLFRIWSTFLATFCHSSEQLSCILRVQSGQAYQLGLP